MLFRSLLTMASSLESTIAASRSASRCARSTRLRSRTIFEAPMISPAGRPNRRHGQGNRHERAVLPQPDGLEMIDDLAAPDGPEHMVLFRLPIGRDDQANGLPDHLGRRVTEQPFGGTVPRHDRPVQILADDRVVARLDDGGEMPRVPLEPPAFGDVARESARRRSPCPPASRSARPSTRRDALTILADADGFVVVDAFAAAKPGAGPLPLRRTAPGERSGGSTARSPQPRCTRRSARPPDSRT